MGRSLIHRLGVGAVAVAAFVTLGAGAAHAHGSKPGGAAPPTPSCVIGFGSISIAAGQTSGSAGTVNYTVSGNTVTGWEVADNPPISWTSVTNGLTGGVAQAVPAATVLEWLTALGHTTPGNYTIWVRPLKGPSNADCFGSAYVTVTAATLPRTGSNVAVPTTLALSGIVLGAAMLIIRRRRMNPTV